MECRLRERAHTAGRTPAGLFEVTASSSLSGFCKTLYRRFNSARRL
jgi:hypothetical protein